jgi:transcriptional regulator with XRE-family HTH domain
MLSMTDASILSSHFRKLAFMTYGKRLQQALERAKKDRAALAAELQVSVQAVGQVITGGRSGTQTFTAENNAKAARFLRIDPNWLATGEGEIAPAANVWPFTLLTPEQLQELPQEHLETVEKVALDLWRTSKVPMPSTLVTSDTKGVHRKNGLTGTVPKPPDISKAGSAAQRSESEGQGRKAGDGRRG